MSDYGIGILACLLIGGVLAHFIVKAYRDR